jgi:hypothetical protein
MILAMNPLLMVAGRELFGISILQQQTCAYENDIHISRRQRRVESERDNMNL